MTPSTPSAPPLPNGNAGIDPLGLNYGDPYGLSSAPFTPPGMSNYMGYGPVPFGG